MSDSRLALSTSALADVCTAAIVSSTPNAATTAITPARPEIAVPAVRRVAVRDPSLRDHLVVPFQRLGGDQRQQRGAHSRGRVLRAVGHERRSVVASSLRTCQA